MPGLLPCAGPQREVRHSLLPLMEISFQHGRRIYQQPLYNFTTNKIWLRLKDLFKTVNKRDYPGRQRENIRAQNIEKTWLDKEAPVNLKVPLTDILQVLDCLWPTMRLERQASASLCCSLPQYHEELSSTGNKQQLNTFKRWKDLRRPRFSEWQLATMWEMVCEKRVWK